MVESTYRRPMRLQVDGLIPVPGSTLTSSVCAYSIPVRTRGRTHEDVSVAPGVPGTLGKTRVNGPEWRTRQPDESGGKRADFHPREGGVAIVSLLCTFVSYKVMGSLQR